MSYIDRCERFLSEKCGGRAFLTPSCTSATEMSVRMLGISVGDEVIMPSFAYPSIANAVILAGGIPIFVDIETKTLNIDHQKVFEAINSRTKAIITVHYAGNPAGIPTKNIPVIEDAAQSIGNYRFSGKFGCMSFHYTKNVQCGQGGAWFVPENMIEDAEFMRFCGLSRFRDKSNYHWESVGTHGWMSEYSAEHLWKELERLEDINFHRRKIWKIYYDGVPGEKATLAGNGHIFWFLEEKRDELLQKAKEKGLRLTKHYEALHRCGPGIRYGKSHQCPNSEMVSQKIVRLPTDVGVEEAFKIVEIVNDLRRSL